MDKINLKHWKYQRMLEERRGHNYQYPNNEQQLKNEVLGYKHHIFEDGRQETMSETKAKKVVEQYRSTGYFSRIVCYSNAIARAKYFSVIYRKKKR